MLLSLFKSQGRATALRPALRQVLNVEFSNRSAHISTFDWDDPLLIREQLSEDEAAVGKTANDYCQKELLPRVTGVQRERAILIFWLGQVLTLRLWAEACRVENYDRAILEEMGQLGFLGSTINGYGCSGVSSVASGVRNFHFQLEWI
jgi:glutaryl-CoA dehydrogenase